MRSQVSWGHSMLWPWSAGSCGLPAEIHTPTWAPRPDFQPGRRWGFPKLGAGCPWGLLCLSSRTTLSTVNAQPSPAAWSPAAPLHLVTSWTSIMLTPGCADQRKKELVALSATRGVSLCWGQEQAEVAFVPGATLSSAIWTAVVLGRKGHRRKTFRSCRARRDCLFKIPLCHKQ